MTELPASIPFLAAGWCPGRRVAVGPAVPTEHPGMCHPERSRRVEGRSIRLWGGMREKRCDVPAILAGQLNSRVGGTARDAAHRRGGRLSQTWRIIR